MILRDPRVPLAIVTSTWLACTGCSTFLAASAGPTVSLADEVRPSAWVEVQGAMGTAPNDDVDVAVGLSGVGSFGQIVGGGLSEDVYAVVRKDQSEEVFVASGGLLQLAGRDLDSDETVADLGFVVRAGPVLFGGEGEHAAPAFLPRVIVQGGARLRSRDDEGDAWRTGGFFSVGIVVGVFSAGEYNPL